nr:hypothetical protein [Tanacetum cinerariifolium]
LGVVVCAGGEWWRSWGVVGEVENGWESGEKDTLALCLGKTLPVSTPGCALCQDCVAFCLKTSAFCLKTKLRFAPAFCQRYIALRFGQESTLRFDSAF